MIQARVLGKVDNTFHQINHSPVDSAVCFVATYPLDSDFSGGGKLPGNEGMVT